MKYEKTISVASQTAAYIDAWLAGTVTNDTTFSATAHFRNGREMDVKICPDDEGGDPWSEAVLFNEKGGQLTCTDPGEDFFGDWELPYDGDLYVVHVTR